MQLQNNELESLENELNLLSHGEEIKRIGLQIETSTTTADNSLLDQLDELIREIRTIADINDSANELREKLVNVREEIIEAGQLSASMSDAVEYDPERILEIEERLNLINRLLNKYNVQSSSDLMEIENELIKKYESFSTMDQDLSQLESQLEKIRIKLETQAQSISQKRISGGKLLEDRVNNILHDLSMKNAELNVEINTGNTLRESGTDHVNFLFSPNRGSTYLPLSKVASGGELSRINLALKSTIAGALTLPTLIFDEIDSGVSGQVALMMGKILHKLSHNHQTICITHSPQIAAQADTHYKIYKTDMESRTFTHVKQLNSEERKIEIAKMLSGDPPSNEAINNAKQLLQVT